jgi:hypothetical protein
MTDELSLEALLRCGVASWAQRWASIARAGPNGIPRKAGSLISRKLIPSS